MTQMFGVEGLVGTQIRNVKDHQTDTPFTVYRSMGAEDEAESMLMKGRSVAFWLSPTAKDGVTGRQLPGILRGVGNEVSSTQTLCFSLIVKGLPLRSGILCNIDITTVPLKRSELAHLRRSSLL